MEYRKEKVFILRFLRCSRIENGQDKQEFGLSVLSENRLHFSDTKIVEFTLLVKAGLRFASISMLLRV